MRIDGNRIAEDIQSELKQKREQLSFVPCVSLIYVKPNPVIDTYIAIKQKTAEAIGIELSIKRFDDPREEEVIQCIHEESQKAYGIVVQLPLPETFNRDTIISAVPVSKDIDVLSGHAFKRFEEGTTKVLPPVVGAIAEVLNRNEISLENKRVVLIGKGKLVGTPVIAWLALQGITPLVLEQGDSFEVLKTADIVISGVGKSWIITPEVLKEGCILIDAGTSVEEGVSKGDIHPDCEEKTSLFCGVPGGIGPITVSILFKNLFYLLEEYPR